MKYIRLFEERMQDFEIMTTFDSQMLVDELRKEIKRPLYNLDYIRDLVTYGHFDIDQLWKNEDGIGITTLMFASEVVPDSYVIRVLLEGGADPNLENENGETSLMKSVIGQNALAIREILKYPQTDINIRNSFGITALMLASNLGLAWVVEELLNHPSIDPNVQNRDGSTALHLASDRGFSETVKYLLNHPKTNPNIQDNYRITALMDAIINRRSQAVEELLKHPKTNLSLTNKRGQTAWDLARDEMREEFPNLKPEGE